MFEQVSGLPIKKTLTTAIEYLTDNAQVISRYFSEYYLVIFHIIDSHGK